MVAAAWFCRVCGDANGGDGAGGDDDCGGGGAGGEVGRRRRRWWRWKATEAQSDQQQINAKHTNSTTQIIERKCKAKKGFGTMV